MCLLRAQITLAATIAVVFFFLLWSIPVGFIQSLVTVESLNILMRRRRSVMLPSTSAPDISRFLFQACVVSVASFCKRASYRSLPFASAPRIGRFLLQARLAPVDSSGRPFALAVAPSPAVSDSKT